MFTLEEVARYAALSDFDHGSLGEIFMEDSQKYVFFMNKGLIEKTQIIKDRGYSNRKIRGEKIFFQSSNLPLDKTFSSPINGFVSGNFYPFDLMFCIQQDRERVFILLREIDSFMRAKEFVKNVIIRVVLSQQDIWILREDNTLFNDKRPLFSLLVQLIVEKDDVKDEVTMTLSQRGYFSTLETSWMEEAKRVLDRADTILRAKPCRGGDLPVVLGPGVTGVLLHEAIGHGLEADFHNKNTSVFYNRIGSQISSPEVTIVDDGTRLNARGSINFDDEGTPTQCTTLLQNGMLVSLLCDRFHGAALGMKSTGNGRRESFRHCPMPRMTNTYMKQGSSTVEEMISGIKYGLYGKHFSHGQVDIVSGNFAFSGSEMYLIEDGKITRPVRGCTISGLGLDVLSNIVAVGNDLEFDPSGGTCGKNGQWVPVGVGQPSISVSSLMVGCNE